MYEGLTFMVVELDFFFLEMSTYFECADNQDDVDDDGTLS